MSYRQKLENVANRIAYHPKLRAEYFANPDKVLAWALPWRGRSMRWQRADLFDKIIVVINRDPRLISAREASSFLTEALRNPQRTFDAIVRLSTLAFFISAAFLAGAIAAAFLGEDTTQKAVLAGLSGGGGAATTLGTVFAISRDAIRKANTADSQIRLILTGYGSEISHLRAIGIDTGIGTIEEAKARNIEIREATMQAVESLTKFVAAGEMRMRPDTAGTESDTEGGE